MPFHVRQPGQFGPASGQPVLVAHDHLCRVHAQVQFDLVLPHVRVARGRQQPAPQVPGQAEHQDRLIARLQLHQHNLVLAVQTRPADATNAVELQVPLASKAEEPYLFLPAA